MIGTTRQPRRKKRTVLIVLVSVLLLLAAAALGGLWWLHKSYSYPDSLRGTVEAVAQDYSLDPLLVASVIRTESRWHPDAHSKAGAEGLMQVMPATGKWIAEMNHWEYSEDKLLDAEYSIKAGCWYLRRLFDKFGEDKLTVVLAAYNAGDTRVKRWLDEGTFDKNLAATHETSDYVTKVESAYGWYKFLYKSR